MFEEHHLIPFEATAIPAGENWLVFAPHADDETFGMGGTLLWAKKQSISSRLVIMTNGKLGIKQLDAEKTAQIRADEARQAAHMLGMEQLIFLNKDDRGLKVDDKTIALVAHIIREQKPHTIFIPGPMELHPDHRATSQLVWQALKRINFQGNLYGYEISVQGPVNTLIDITEFAAEKLRIMQVYKSQLQENNYIEVIQGLDRARTYTLPAIVGQAEGFLKLKPHDTATLGEQLQQLLQPYSEPYDVRKVMQQLEMEKREMLQSTSWKLTRPLRWIGRLLGRG